MSLRYRIRRSGKEYGPDLSLTTALSRINTRLKADGGPFRIKQAGAKDFGPLKRRSTVMASLAWNLPRLKPQDVIRIRTQGGSNPGFAIKAIEEAGLQETTPSWYATYISSKEHLDPAVARVARVAVAFDPAILCQGTLVCKWTVPGQVISQHAWGRAIDLVHPLPPPIGASNTKNLELAQYLASHAEELDIFHVICTDRQWTPSEGWHYYGGTFHTHVHVGASAQGPGANYMPGWC